MVATSFNGSQKVLERIKRVVQTLDPEANAQQISELNAAMAALEHELKLGIRDRIIRATFTAASLAKFIIDQFLGG